MVVNNLFKISFIFLGAIFGYSQHSVCQLTQAQINQNIFNCLQRNNIGTNKLIDMITDEIGIAPNFTYIPCRETYNAIATINIYKNNARYILYDDIYFSNIYNNNKYATLFILAHEIAHHINGHTIPTKYSDIQEQQIKELEADYFAGFIMFKFGAKEQDIINIINEFPDPNTDSETHPRNSRRIEYALRGYLNEYNKYKSELYRLRDKFKKSFENEEQAKLIEDLTYYINDFAMSREKEKRIKDMSVALYIVDKLKDFSPDIESLKGYVYFKNQMYEESKKYYKKLYLTSDKDKEYNLQMYLSSMDKLNITTQEDLIFIKNFENSNNPNILFHLGISYKRIGQSEKGSELLKKAYDLVKNQDDTILKSDIIFHYARVLYDENIHNIISGNTKKLSLAKVLILKSIDILNKYPDNIYFRFYYNRMLFHLGNIQMAEDNYLEAIDTFNKLLEIEREREEKAHEEYQYKVNSSLGLIYLKTEDYQKAIQHFTNSINLNDKDIEHKTFNLMKRAESYMKMNNIELFLEDISFACKLGNREACNIINKK